MSASAGVSVRQFYPTLGSVGTEVTLLGTGFSPVPAKNVVQFGGIAAVVYSATETELRVEVPFSAVTGFITVTAPGGHARTPSIFTVVSSNPT